MTTPTPFYEAVGSGALTDGFLNRIIIVESDLGRQPGGFVDQIEMPDDLRAKYDKLEKEFFLVLDSGKEVEAFNQAALTNKCLQFSNGAMYPIAGMPLWEPVHDMKLDALEDIIDEAQGSPVLCAYAYRSDAERIMTRFKDLRPINLTDCKSEASLTNAMHRWKTGDCSLMIGHPASMGHGIDGHAVDVIKVAGAGVMIVGTLHAPIHQELSVLV